MLITPAVAQTGDYDSENNRYIDITTLAQLNAIRYDLNGDGAVAASDTANYNAAFPNAATGMGCPSSGCVGYELKADLDFDTNDDNVVDANDNPSFPNWNPISTRTNKYTAEFKGNNRTISNLTITTHQNHQGLGLFNNLSPTALVTGVGMVDANINVPSAPQFSDAGALAGLNEGTIRSSYSTGSVSVTSTASPGTIHVGGLVGRVVGGTIAASWSTANVSSTGEARGGGLLGQLGFGTSGGSIIASYATGSVTVTGGAGITVRGGGLVGLVLPNASVTASYAAGPVSVNGTTTHVGGLIGQKIGANITISMSYWDTATSGIDDDADSTEDEGKSTSDLQSPTGYTGIYSDWNVNVDGIEGPDDPWDFGTENQYPMIKFVVIYPLSQVQGVSVMPGPGGLVVSWTATRDATGYKVQWKSGDEDYDVTDRQAIVTDGTTYTIPNLSADTEYTVRVIATRTNADDGPASDEATGTPDESGTTLPEPDPDTEPVFIEAADPQTYRQNQAIEFTLPAAIDGNGTLTYTLTDLPEGLTFDAETLVVSGTPSEMTEKAIYTLTVTDEDGDSAEMSFFITVLANVAPSFGDASVDAQILLRKQEIDSLTLPQASGGDGSLTYALTPDLPDGLVFDAETRIVSGTPLEAMGETTYTLTATDGDGDAATLMFTLEVIADPMPTFGDTTLTAQFYQHREIEPLALPQASGGDEPLTYALMPDLPEGLTFNAETRIVSGTPLEAMDETTYTLTAIDGNGDEVYLLFTLEIPDLMPTFGDTTLAAQCYFVNVQTSPRAFPEATGGDGMVVYILLPFLPEGLSFDSDTRTIVGTPTEVTAEATYTYSALDADGDVASLTFTLAVRMPSSDFNGDGNVNFADFILLVGKYGFALGEDGYDARYDLDGDGQIDFADFLIFAASFGATG